MIYQTVALLKLLVFVVSRKMMICEILAFSFEFPVCLIEFVSYHCRCHEAN